MKFWLICFFVLVIVLQAKKLRGKKIKEQPQILAENKSDYLDLMFRESDSNHNGKIDFKEIYHYFEETFIDLDPKVIASSAKNDFDKDKSGDLDWNEFVEWEAHVDYEEEEEYEDWYVEGSEGDIYQQTCENYGDCDYVQ